MMAKTEHTAGALQPYSIRVIISPAKKMNADPDTLPAESLPVFPAETEQIIEYLKSLSYAEARALWRCNDKLTELNFARVQEMELHADMKMEEGSRQALSSLTPALLAYEGIQYRYLAPKTLDEGALSWLSEHLRILSGFYGVLRPFDGVMPYRLEMQAEAKIGGKRNLYEFWGDKLRRALGTSPVFILNLASKEYAKAVEPHLRYGDRWLSCVFAEQKDGKLVQKATLAKMARGEMTRYLAETLSHRKELDGTMQVGELMTAVKNFNRLGFSWSEAHSTERELVFICGSKTGDHVKN